MGMALKLGLPITRREGSRQNTLFGMNMSGAEAPTINNPTNADFVLLRSLGFKYIRYSLAMENLQPTYGAALDTTKCAAIDVILGYAAANNLTVQLDVHNFGAKATPTAWGTTVFYAGNVGVPAANVNIYGDGTFTVANFADFHDKLIRRFTGRPGFGGIGLSNEPSIRGKGVNLLSAPNGFSAIEGQKPWFPTNSCVITRLAEGTNPLGSAYGAAWDFDTGVPWGSMVQGVPLTAQQYTLSAWLRTTTSTQAVVLAIGDKSTAVTATTTWQRLSFTTTPTADVNATVQIGDSGGVAGRHYQVANAMLNTGATAGTYEPHPFLPYFQAGIAAIRAVDATCPIYCSAMGAVNSSSQFKLYNYEMNQLVAPGVIIDPHAYFDGSQGVGGGGGYSGSWASYGITASTGAAIAQPVLDWMTEQSISASNVEFGEFGIPGNADQANWLTAQASFLAALRARGVSARSWYFGSNGSGVGNILNVGQSPTDARMLQIAAA